MLSFPDSYFSVLEDETILFCEFLYSNLGNAIYNVMVQLFFYTPAIALFLDALLILTSRMYRKTPVKSRHTGTGFFDVLTKLFNTWDRKYYLLVGQSNGPDIL